MTVRSEGDGGSGGADNDHCDRGGVRSSLVKTQPQHHARDVDDATTDTEQSTHEAGGEAKCHRSCWGFHRER